VSIVIPVYFNETSLVPLARDLQEVETQLAERGLGTEVIFVDDGSLDGSLATLLEIKRGRPATRVIQLTRNFGSVHASKIGAQFMTGDCLVYLAADRQDPPRLIPLMVDRWLAGARYVICVREKRDESWAVKIWSAWFYVLVRWLVVADFPRGGYSMALHDKALVPYLQSSSKNINPHVFAYWLGFSPAVIPYERAKSEHGRSRWTLAKKWTFMLDSLLGFSIVPIRLMSVIGLGVSLVSVAYGVMIFVNALRGRFDTRGFPTVVTLVAFLLGLVIFMLGIIGEYLWRIFDEVNRRPEAVIAEIH
jgi:dolichol-phosphate mannosyltransferase